MSILRSRHQIVIFALFNLGNIRPASSLTGVTIISPTASSSPASSSSQPMAPKVITISEKVWRKAASKHSNRIQSLLQPGLTAIDDPINAGKFRKMKGTVPRCHRPPEDDWTALDPINPIYNFLIEYYGLKGAKGPRRLARWAPDPKLLSGMDADNGCDIDHYESTISTSADDNDVYTAAMKASHGLGGILLENANLDDLGGTLHLRGSVPVPVEGAEHVAIQSTTPEEEDEDEADPELHGILYNPAVFYNRHFAIDTDDSDRRKQLRKSLAPFQWYSSILRTTTNSDPILHCYGLHEWAMQYHPEGAPPPPSAKYQSNLNLRVSREVINETVERKGVRCTHVDALRFFAPAAGPLNHHGSSLERMDQLRLEQKGCVHAHMDLLKISLKLQPFFDSELMGDILEVALAARKLDVEASPYDATAFGAGIVPVETNEGRKMYREEQILLMKRAEPVRERLLDAYDVFMKLAFDEELLGEDLASKDRKLDADNASADNVAYVAPERLAIAEPGGLPWRKSLIEKK